MAKYTAFYKECPSSTPYTIGVFNTIEDAARACDNKAHGEYDHACIEAIIERGYYGIGYSSAQVYVEEIK